MYLVRSWFQEHPIHIRIHTYIRIYIYTYIRTSGEEASRREDSRVLRVRRQEGQESSWGRAGDAVSVSTFKNEGNRRNGPITYSCAPKWFQPCNRPVRCVTRIALTRGCELKRQPAILAVRRLSPTEIRTTDIVPSEICEREMQISSDRTSGLTNFWIYKL